MRRVTCLTVWALLAAALGAGCQKSDWNWTWDRETGKWSRQAPAPAPAPASPSVPAYANTPASAPAAAPSALTPLRPEEEAALRIENASFRQQLDDMKAREGRLARDNSDLQVLVNGHERTIQALADAPVERDQARRQVEALKAENEQLRAEIRRLGGTPPVPASLPAAPIAPAVRAAPPAGRHAAGAGEPAGGARRAGSAHRAGGAGGPADHGALGRAPVARLSKGPCESSSQGR